MLSLIDNQLEKLACDQTQAFFSKGDWQLYHLLEWILLQTGKATVFISSYSVSEEFIRQLTKLQAKDLVKSLAVLIDSRAAQKAIGLSIFTAQVSDEILLGNNHSKIILIENENFKVSVVTSQNQTRGNRYEAGVVMTDTKNYKKLLKAIIEVKPDCINGSELFRRGVAKN